MQVTALTMFVFQLFTLITRRDDCIELWERHWVQIVAAGISIGSCFFIYVVALSLTSMSHCLLLASTEPLYMLAYNYFKERRANRYEIAGVLLSIIGITLISATSGSEAKATWYGDLIALSSSSLFVAYLIISSDILQDPDQPILHYFFGTALVGCVTNFLLLCVFVPQEVIVFFTWFTTSDWIYLAWLGIIPGALGQLGSSMLLKHVSTLIVTVFIGLVPPIGSFIGWTFGFQDVPPIETWVGGFLCMTGCAVVSVAGDQEKPEYTPIPDKELD